MKKFPVLLMLAFSLMACDLKSSAFMLENDFTLQTNSNQPLLYIKSLSAQQGIQETLDNNADSQSSAVFSKMDLYANIETVGVVVSGTNLPKTAELMVQRDDETDWYSGHLLMRIDNGRLVGSLFGLSPATSYNIKVLDGSTEISGSITTQADELQFTPTVVLYVDDDALPDGDGSKSKPFKTIQEGVNHATAGAQVLVADGIYREAVSFPESGAEGKWIQVKAEGSGAILDGS
jgi:hypothetical protein